MHSYFSMTFPSFHFSILMHPSRSHHNSLPFTAPHFASLNFTFLHCTSLHFALFISFLTLFQFGSSIYGLQKNVVRNESTGMESVLMLTTNNI